MDRDQARELLVKARNAIDEAGKKIVEDYERHDEARNLAAEDARGKVMREFVEGIGIAADRLRAAFDQWEIREPHPLNEDRSFMDAYHVLMRELDDFARSGGGS